MLVRDDEAARVHQPVNSHQRLDPAEGGQHHGPTEIEIMLGLFTAILVHFGDMADAVFDTVDLGIGDPLDVAIAQFAFEQRLGVAHAVQAKGPM